MIRPNTLCIILDSRQGQYTSTVSQLACKTTLPTATLTPFRNFSASTVVLVLALVLPLTLVLVIGLVLMVVPVLVLYEY